MSKRNLFEELKLGLENIHTMSKKKGLTPNMKNTYQITVYIPKAQCEAVKEAMFQAGAGKIDTYEACSWQVLGQGQFRPLKGAKPFLGEQDKLEMVEEYKVEMLCFADKLEDVMNAMKEAHPYEVPAYGVVALLDI